MHSVFHEYPNLLQEWHPNRNPPLNDLNLTKTSRVFYWWLGGCGHEWETSLNIRCRGSGCPYCSGNKVLEGFNDLKTTHPELIPQWSERNIFSPTEKSAGSKTKVVWVCELGHEWEAQIVNRTRRKSGCPYCSGNKVLEGFNDLKTTHPELIPQWSNKNVVKSTEVTAGSHVSVIWCGLLCGHEWERKVSKQVVSAGCPVCINRTILKGTNDLATTHPEVFNKLSKTNEYVDVSYGSNVLLESECDKGHVWKAHTYHLSAGSGCPKCVGVVSQPEIEIKKFLVSFGLKVEVQKKGLLSGKQTFDLYVPEKNVAIEFNGLYWHSEKFKPKNFHYMKWYEAHEKGIQLIQIWEDDWVKNSGLVKNMLKYKLGLNEDGKVYARNTEVRFISSGVAQEFLNKNHIQGFMRGTSYIGLFDKTADLLVAVMVVTRNNKNFSKANLVRYATCCSVVGGFSKLLSFVVKKYSLKEVVTFADLTVSDGGLYEVNGFVKDKVLLPDYMYVVNKRRVHKFGYRLKRFRNDPNLIFEDNLTEKQLAELNKLPRVWDAGKIRYVKLYL